MIKPLTAVTNFIRDEQGASAVEYAILIAAIAAAVVLITFTTGRQINAAFQTVCDAIETTYPALKCE